MFVVNAVSEKNMVAAIVIAANFFVMFFIKNLSFHTMYFCAHLGNSNTLDTVCQTDMCRIHCISRNTQGNVAVLLDLF